MDEARITAALLAQQNNPEQLPPEFTKAQKKRMKEKARKARKEANKM
jgi:hypothetical protein